MGAGNAFLKGFEFVFGGISAIIAIIVCVGVALLVFDMAKIIYRLILRILPVLSLWSVAHPMASLFICIGILSFVFALMTWNFN